MTLSQTYSSTSDEFQEISHFLKVTTAPADEPVLIDECNLYSRLDTQDEATLVRSWLKAAREMVEKDSRRPLMSQTLTLYMDCFPARTIYLERSPVISVTSIGYVDTDGSSQTLATSHYRTDLVSEPARITPAYGDVWPFTRYQTNAVNVVFIAGYATVAEVPEIAKELIRTVVDFWYLRPGTIKTVDEFSDYYWNMIGRLQWGIYA